MIEPTPTKAFSTHIGDGPFRQTQRTQSQPCHQALRRLPVLLVGERIVDYRDFVPYLAPPTAHCRA